MLAPPALPQRVTLGVDQPLRVGTLRVLNLPAEGGAWASHLILAWPWLARQGVGRFARIHGDLKAAFLDLAGVVADLDLGDDLLYACARRNGVNVSFVPALGLAGREG